MKETCIQSPLMPSLRRGLPDLADVRPLPPRAPSFMGRATADPNPPPHTTSDAQNRTETAEEGGAVSARLGGRCSPGVVREFPVPS